MNETKKVIFVVDDDIHVQKLINFTLKDEYQLEMFSEPMSALAALSSTIPYLILLDLHIPNIDGFEMLQMLKNHPITYDIPVVCISGDGSDSSRKRIESLGGLGLIKKPLKQENLSKIISSFLDRAFLHLTDMNHQMNFYIYHSNREKNSLIDTICTENSLKDIPVYFLSWKDGNEYYDENLQMRELIDEQKVYFLEIKSTFPMRLPYLQDLSPIFHDLEQFFIAPPNQSHIILDDLYHLIKSAPSLSQDRIITFINFLKKDFKKVTIINTMDPQAEHTEMIHQIARKLIA